MKNGTSDSSMRNEKRSLEEHSANDGSNGSNSPDATTGETLQRSKFGRLRKPNISPCMEYLPLVRVRPSHASDKSSSPDLPDKRSSPYERRSSKREKLDLTTGGVTKKRGRKRKGQDFVEEKREKLDILEAPKEPEKVKSTEPAEQYLVGDLLWSKIGNHPFWPAMVSFDPVSGIYTKLVKNSLRLYHVQYFGPEPQHGWTQPKRTLPYQGLSKFAALGNLQRPPYDVPTRKRSDWLVAVQEADEASEMTRAERKQKLTFEYYNRPTKNSKSPPQPLQENRAVEKPKEDLCLVCEKTGATLSCAGPCKMSFHLDCLGIAHAPTEFLCDECTTGQHPCFVCKKPEQTEKCSLDICGTFYHVACLKNLPLPLKLEPFICPRHFCLSCFQNKPRNFNSKGRLLRCTQCPAAFHSPCLPAGSSPVSNRAVVCPRHGPPVVGTAVNVSWCMMCTKLGKLLCCDGCPSAMHASCLGLEADPEGPFLCADCLSWKHPKQADIVWVKLGCYRWWPALVCDPAEVPDNILALKHRPVGDFVVRFYGSHDYYWTNRKRVFLFAEGDRGSLAASSKSLATLFKAALDEATLAWDAQRRARECSEKPTPFRMIRSCKPVGQVSMPALDLHSVSVCACSVDDPCRANCLNRMLMYECHRDLCPARERCENQRFQKRQYAQTSVVHAPRRGWGLQADQALAAGDFIMEYVGEIIDERECARRLAQLEQENSRNFYFITLEKDRVIDAGPRGNLSRFINHSCEPNCESRKWTVNGDTRIGIFAIKDIEPGTELTFNYNLDSRGNEKIPCACGSENCSGYMGVRPRPPESDMRTPKRRRGPRGGVAD